MMNRRNDRMNKKEFSRKVAETLRNNDIRKPVISPKHVFHISDDCGNSKDFVVKQSDRNLLFTIMDVENIVDACLDVIIKLLANGDSITFRGFGTLGLRYRKGRRMRDNSGEWIDCPPGFMPKLVCGKDLKRSAKLYEVSLQEKLNESEALKALGEIDGA